MKLVSTTFENGGEIPKAHTCEGADHSPPLAFHDVPSATKSLVLIVDDPDAPDPRAPKRTWVHWVVYNVPPNVTGFSESVRDFPAGARQGKNDWNNARYQGPCPPIGRHRYFHKLYALDIVLPDLGAPTKAELEQAMQGHVIEQAELVGTYEKREKK
jgi:Raf kinase inhibitor-like YbhB/YbcL family protein